MVNVAAFCYIERPMRPFARIANSPRWPAVWMAVIIGSLCFSVGEGLRLTPFPVSQVAEINGLTPADDAGSSPLAKYGPLDVPSPVQKRSKRQTTDFACHNVTAGSQLLTVLRHLAADESRQLSPLVFVSRPAGRAPPLAS